MKKTLTSIIAIALLAVAGGIAYAFFSETAVADTNVVTAGDVNLRLSKTDANTNFADSLSDVWSLANMAPGGQSVVGEIWMKNIGTVNTDLMRFAVSSIAGTANMAKQVRITELSYGGKSLLSGGAGADLSDYQAPYNCPVTVSDTAGLNAAIASAPAAPTASIICMDPGTYTGSISLSKPIVLVAKNAPNTASASVLKGSIAMGAAGAYIKGLYVMPQSNSTNAIQMTASNTTVDSVIIDGADHLASTQTIKGVYVYNATAPNITTLVVKNTEIRNINNVAAKGMYGIMVQGLVGTVLLEHNTIKNLTTPLGWGASGIEVTPTGITTDNTPTAVVIRSNHIEGMGNGVLEPGKAITIDFATNGGNTWYADPLQVSLIQNDFVNTELDVRVAHPSNTLNAQNNWWGDFTPDTQGLIDSTNFAGGAFIGFINGVDGNTNGYADLVDFATTPLTNVKPGLLAGGSPVEKLRMALQLDGPTTGNEFQNGSVTFNMDITMEQLPEVTP